MALSRHSPFTDLHEFLAGNFLAPPSWQPL